MRKEKQQQAPFLTEKELAAVLKAARDESPRNHAMFLMTYLHGLRACEVAALKVGDIRDGHLEVQRAKGSMYTRQALTRWKGNKLMDEVTVLKTWLKARDTDSPALFTSRKTGRNLTREQVSREFHRTAEVAGLPLNKRFVHILKHSIATHCCEADMPIIDVKQLLGHESIDSTMSYARSSDYKAVRAMQSALQHYRSQ